MSEISVHVRLYMLIEIIYFDIISLYIDSDLPETFWDYEIYCNGKLIKKFNNPILNKNNSYEFTFTTTVENKEKVQSLTLHDYFKNFITLENSTKAQFTPIYTTDLLTALFCSNKIYVIKNDGSDFKEEDYEEILSIRNQILSDYIDNFGPISYLNDMDSISSADGKIYKLNFNGLNFEQGIVEEDASIKLNHILPT